MKSRKFYVLLYISNEYYKQTLQSLLNQSIGFDRHINLILAVSSDFFYTEELKRIISQHFENISYLGQISKGEFQKRAYFRIKGKYVHYAECGSVYQRNTFKIISFLFSKRGNGIEVVLARYDSKKKNDLIRQVISRVPKGERIVDLDEYDEIPLFFWNYSFVRADSIVSTRKNKAGKWSKGYSTEIEELLSFRLLAEVFHANPRVLLTKQTLVEASPAKRRSSNFFPEYQQDPEQLRVFRENVIEPVYQKYKIETPRFIQYNLIRLFRWCATESSATDVISEVYDVQEFKGFLNKVINKIDDDYLMKINQNARDKVFFFRCKQNELDIVLEEEDKVLKHGETEILRSSLVYTKVELIDFEKNKLKIRVRAKFLNEEDKEKATFYAKVNHQNQYFAKEGKGRYDSICWDQIVYPGKAFDIEIPLDSKEKIQRISLFEGGQGVEVKREKIGFGRYAPISENNRRGYYYHKGWLMFFDGGRKDIVLKRTSRIRLPYLEARLLFSLLMKRRKNALLSIPVRVAYWGLYPVMKDKRIWLISDRADRGDDNGEAFLKYLQKHRPKGVYYYFVIDRKSEEGKRISKYARTITPFSVKHTLYHLFAEYIISSQANSPVLGVVPNIYFRDIRHHMKFVFLQHGVTKDDQSAWLNRYSRNIYGLVVATDPEYRSMFDYDYYYEKKNIWLTGFPRNDLLYRDEKRYITLMPTWRKYLMEPKPDPVTGRWILREDIEDIEYSKFYSALIQSTRLKKALEKYGYTLCMKPHPLVEPYLDELFSGMENVKVFEENVAYRDVFAWSDLILTDYSSTAFDFAYLRKPIIYTHFDIETFRAGGHSYVEGYFDYERDGFGEVAYTLDDTIDLIIDYVKNDCQPKEKYLERVNKTFAFNDKENSKRVLERLLLGDSYEEAEEKEIEKGVEEKVIPHTVHYREESAVNEWKQDTEKDQRNGEFLFSSVMAIYNMEDYLREAVDSILQQTIGFEENIQLILVDDGSTDGSSAICDEYAKEYPNNIIAIHKENGGVSSARNEGKKKATGRYVNFPDPDDYFDLDAYERVGVFFEEHYNETDVVCIPIVMFGEKEGEYWQNYKFRKGKRIIDLRKEWEVSCMNSTCSFIKNVKAIDVDFDEELVMSEDTKYLTEILCDKMTLGVVGNCRYWYRIRDNSTIRKAKEDRRTYFPIQNRLQQYIIKKCVEELGYVPQYVQNILMMDIGWKIRAVEYPEEAMSKEDTKQYLKYMLSLVETFDDEVILRQRNIYWEHKYFLFKRKYGEDLKLEPVYLDINYLLYGQVLRKMSQLRMVVENLCIEKDELYVSGYIPLIGIDDNANVQVAYAIDDKVYLMKNREPTEGVKEIIESVCGKLCKRYFFDGRIPVFDEYFGKNIVFYLLVDNHPVWMKNIGFGERAPFSGKWKNEYYISDEYFVKQRSDSLKIGLLEKESDIKKLEDDFKKEIRDTLKKKSKNPMFENSPEKQQLEELLNLASG